MLHLILQLMLLVVNWGTPSLQPARYYQETLQIDLVACLQTVACQEA